MRENKGVYTPEEYLAKRAKKEMRENEIKYAELSIYQSNAIISTGLLHYIDSKHEAKEGVFYETLSIKQCKDSNGNPIPATELQLEQANKTIDVAFAFLEENGHI